jgi:PAS domain S-box-containing protein
MSAPRRRPRRRPPPPRASRTNGEAAADGRAAPPPTEAAPDAAHLAALEREVGRTRDLERLVQSLEVYQEEVRGQNEKLIETQVALEQSLARFAELYEHAPVAYLTLDRNGVVLEANRTALSLLHVRREALVGAPLLFYVTDGERRGFLDHMRECRRHEEPPADEPHTLTAELNIKSRSGAVLPVLLSTRRAHAEAGRGVLFRMTLADLTERKEAERQVRLYQQQLSAMAVESAMAAERERRRIAVEVHDTLSQSLVLAKMKLAGLMKKAAAAGVREDVAGGLTDVTHLVEEVLGQTRTLTFELSPPILYELGFEPALEWLAERMATRHGLNIVVDGGQQCANLPEERAVLLFQLVRELLNNVAKHAGATNVTVRARCRNRVVRVQVVDDGHGFDPGAVHTPLVPTGNGEQGGFGLFSVRTRLEHLGGKLEIRSTPGGPTSISLSLPALSGGGDGGDGPPQFKG